MERMDDVKWGGHFSSPFISRRFIVVLCLVGDISYCYAHQMFTHRLVPQGLFLYLLLYDLFFIHMHISPTKVTHGYHTYPCVTFSLHHCFLLLCVCYFIVSLLHRLPLFVACFGLLWGVKNGDGCFVSTFPVNIIFPLYPIRKFIAFLSG